MPDVDLRKRTKDFAVRIVRLFVALPKTVEAQTLGKQLLRSGTSVGAHYREAQRAKSTADFVSKIDGALQELEESLYWLELIEEVGIFSAEKLKPLSIEGEEILKILVTINKRAKENK
jgi:four helix bundle protein